MVQKMSITMSDYTYNTYLSDYKGNKSEHIETMYLKGIDSEITDVDNYKAKIIQLQTHIKNIQHENNKLKLLNASLKAKLYKKTYDRNKDPKYVAKRNMVRAIATSGIIRDVVRNAEK